MEISTVTFMLIIGVNQPILIKRGYVTTYIVRSTVSPKCTMPGSTLNAAGAIMSRTETAPSRYTRSSCNTESDLSTAACCTASSCSALAFNATPTFFTCSVAPSAPDCTGLNAIDYGAKAGSSSTCNLPTSVNSSCAEVTGL